MSLLELKSKARKKRKRIGRGNGSGHGTYACRGMNGQSSRSGGKRRPGFEGGQTPYLRKMPKLKGFKNINRVEYQVVNTGALNMFNDGDTIDLETLMKKNLISKKNKPVKLLADGDKLEKKLTIIVHKASKKAQEEVKDSKSELTLLIQEEKKEKTQ